MPLLSVTGMTRYFGGLCAVSDFNLAVEPGELIGIIGPNGAGKTTVFNLLTGVYPVSAGNIEFNGRDLSGLPPHRITSLGIARTFQNIRLFKSLSVLDNIRAAHYARLRYNPLTASLHFGRSFRGEHEILRESVELLERFGLRQSAGEPAESLPYGLQRKLEIARALATRPRLLLLDEPAAGMNPNEITGLMEFIRQIRRDFDLTILLIEHQMMLVMNICERLKVLDFGVTIAEGPPKTMRNHPAVLEAYLGDSNG